MYVIKVINVANLDQKAQFEALNEIATMQMLDSQYIVGYHDSFIDDDGEPKINIVIEFCQNGDLTSFLEKQDGKNLTENLVWKIFINMCLGLEQMHNNEIIHRDLKSANIMLTKDKTAKIGDLGCAQNLRETPVQQSPKEERKKSDVQ